MRAISAVPWGFPVLPPPPPPPSFRRAPSPPPRPPPPPPRGHDAPRTGRRSRRWSHGGDPDRGRRARRQRRRRCTWPRWATTGRGGRSRPGRRALLVGAQRRRRPRHLVAPGQRGAVRRDDRLLRRAPRGVRLPRARLPVAPRPRALGAGRAHVAMQNALRPAGGAARPGRGAPGAGRSIDQLDELAGATFSPRDGLVSPDAVREHYRARARAAGSASSTAAWWWACAARAPRVTGGRRWRALDDAEAAAGRSRAAPPAGPRSVVACARHRQRGRPVGGAVADLMGAPVPCRAVPRQLCVVASATWTSPPRG